MAMIGYIAYGFNYSSLFLYYAGADFMTYWLLNREIHWKGLRKFLTIFILAILFLVVPSFIMEDQFVFVFLRQIYTRGFDNLHPITIIDTVTVLLPLVYGFRMLKMVRTGCGASSSVILAFFFGNFYLFLNMKYREAFSYIIAGALTHLILIQFLFVLFFVGQMIWARSHAGAIAPSHKLGPDE